MNSRGLTVVAGMALAIIGAFGVLKLGHAVEEAKAATPLILGPDDGETRYYAPNRPVTFKVDPKDVGSPNLVFAVETLNAGDRIPVHRHLACDEIVFVHRGTFAVFLDGRRTVVGTGSTIYVPRGSLIGLEAAGPEPAVMAYVFDHPGFEERQRLVTCPTQAPCSRPSAAARALIDTRFNFEPHPEIPIIAPGTTPGHK